MTKVVRTINAPPVLVTSVASGIDPYSDWQEIARFPASQCPSTPNGSRDFVVVVTGKVGNFENLVGFTGQACVEVSLRTSQGVLLQQNFMHRVSLNADVYHSPRNQAQPFMFIVRRAAWPTGDDLVLIGRIAKYGDAISTSPRFFCFEAALQCWDTTALGASRYQWDSSQSLAGVTLPVQPNSPLDLGLSAALPWTSGTEQWLVFTSTRYRPRNRVDLANLYWGTFLGGWGSPTFTWGLDRHGGICRGLKDPHPPNFNSVYPNEYQHGLATVLNVSANNIRIGQRGICLYQAGGGVDAAQWVRLDHFSVRISPGMYGLDVVPAGPKSRFYGSREVTATEILHDYTIGEQRPCSVVACALPANRVDLREQDRATQVLVQVNDGAFYPKGSDVYVPQRVASNGYAEGQPDVKMFHVDLPDGAVHLRTFGKINPYSDTLSFLIQGNGGTSINSGTIFVGALSGARAQTLEFLPGGEAWVRVKRLNSIDFSPLEVIFTYSIPQPPFTKDVQYVGQSPAYAAAEMCLVALANDDSTNLYPPDIAPVRGAEIALVPSSQGITLSGLQTIPLLPSHPITWQLSRGDEYLTTVSGYQSKLPPFLKPKATGPWTYACMTGTEKDAMFAFLKANAMWAAQLPGDVKRAYALTGTQFEFRSLGANLWATTFDVLQLEVAP